MPAETIAKTPNILFMMVDQMRGDCLSAAGHPVVRTPGLDRLAREGTRFANAVTPVPVCIAARHSFQTGHRCATHGRHGNNVPQPEPLLYTAQQLLGLAGYHARAIGKMHFRPVRRHHGFHRMELMEEIPDFRQDDEYLMYLQENGYGHKREVHGVRNLLYHLPQVSVIPEEHHGSTWVADRTIDFLKTHGHRPFFCWSSWIAPHPPWNPPEPFASMYPHEDIPGPKHYDRDPATQPPMHRAMKQYASMDSVSDACRRRVRSLYYGSISHIDKGVGRILDTLDELGLAENTLVIFTSDHGEMLGDHGQWQKGKPAEGSVNIPLLARLPKRIDAGAVNDQPVSLLDMLPTFLDLAETPYPGEKPLPGASLLGQRGGGLAEERASIIIEIGRGKDRWLSLRGARYKYNYWLGDGWEELYDRQTDPDEANNLLLGEVAGEDRARADAMKAELAAWEKAHGFADSLDAQGALANHGVDFGAAAPKPINTQFPRWVDHLSADERAAMEGKGATVANAIASETTFDLADLKDDLRAFREAGGTLEGTKYEALWKSL